MTRRAILRAARTAFAEAGYERATIRSIAALAGVDPALLHHHFGSKEDLFAAAHEYPVSPSALTAALESGQGTVGERLTRLLLQADSDATEPFESLVRAAMSNQRARRMLRRFIEKGVLDVVATRLRLPDARLRIALAGSHLVGLFVMRRVIGVDVARATDLEKLVEMVAPVIDHYLTGGLSPGQGLPASPSARSGSS